MAERNDDDAHLVALRERIDGVDDRLLALLNERARLATEVGTAKRDAEADGCYRPEREDRVLQRMRANNPGPLHEEHVLRLFREIMSASLALEGRLAIACLGPEGTYSHAATLKHFGHAVAVQPQADLDEVFRAVEAQRCHFGVVPVENSIEGTVNRSLDRLAQSPLRVCGEVELRIRLCLLADAGSLAAVRRVCSHPQSLAQCRAWLDENLPGVVRSSAPSTAEAARLAAAEPGLAAVAAQVAAERYGLTCLAAGIEDEPDNVTRFLVLGRRSGPPTGNDKTSLLISTPNRAGALHRLLACFAEHGVSMTRIESRPSRRCIGDYVFFIDVEGHADDPEVKAALAQLEQHAPMVKQLGSYPRARY